MSLILPDSNATFNYKGSMVRVNSFLTPAFSTPGASPRGARTGLEVLSILVAALSTGLMKPVLRADVGVYMYAALRG